MARIQVFETVLSEHVIHALILLSPCYGLINYRKHEHFNTTHRKRQNLYALPSSEWKMLAEPPFSILDTLSAVDDAIDDNADLADGILLQGLSSFGLNQNPPKNSMLDWKGSAKPGDIAKAYSTIRQFYRDWSTEGFKSEVEPLLSIILSDLEAYLASQEPRKGNSAGPSILLPGAGLGRILFELCMKGYCTTGNEISYHQLIASNFILNCTQRPHQFPIYPFATNFTNVISRSNQLKRVTIPDIHPATAISQCPNPGEMNMTAGDFVLSYSNVESRENFDAIVSVFFIDTAPNLIRYIETVWNCLKKGGYWINIGPLLWHFDSRVHGKDTEDKEEDDDDEQDPDPAEHPHTHPHSHSTQHQHHTPDSSSFQSQAQDKGIGNPGSFELSDDEVIHLVTKLGFEIQRHEIIDHAPGSNESFGYIQDPNSLLQNRYRCSHWVAKKVG
ncbi:hypothetical protein B0A52_01526 [Exophiala mesophila]|uniref:carnosine N-methyltransferase n=1 Tax=Exophiala mesophila TaxID=212818 RepID=A0A438NFA9_EXOME|nr:hypothetical protein B0A52_01526 [Exophiala mesophila]